MIRSQITPLRVITIPCRDCPPTPGGSLQSASSCRRGAALLWIVRQMLDCRYVYMCRITEEGSWLF